MPVTRRIAKRRREGYPPEIRSYLLTGHWFGLDGSADPDADFARQVWGELRGELLPAFIAENPGRRPWGWWAFDSGEPRRRLDRPERPGRGELWYGCPRFLTQRADFDAEYETEGEYLGRLGLLADSERVALDDSGEDLVE